MTQRRRPRRWQRTRPPENGEGAWRRGDASQLRDTLVEGRPQTGLGFHLNWPTFFSLMDSSSVRGGSASMTVTIPGRGQGRRDDAAGRGSPRGTEVLDELGG